MIRKTIALAVTWLLFTDLQASPGPPAFRQAAQ